MCSIQGRFPETGRQIQVAKILELERTRMNRRKTGNSGCIPSKHRSAVGFMAACALVLFYRLFNIDTTLGTHERLRATGLIDSSLGKSDVVIRAAAAAESVTPIGDARNALATRVPATNLDLGDAAATYDSTTSAHVFQGRAHIGFGEQLLGGDDPDMWPGFPDHPLTLKDLALCNAEKTIVLDKFSPCPQDPTCQECRLHNVIKNEKVLKQYKKKLEQTPAFDEMFKVYDKHMVVMAVNNGQVYLAINWYLSVKANTKLDPCKLALIIATDKQAYETIKKESCMPAVLAEFEDVGIVPKYVQTMANTGAHAAINVIIFAAVNTAVQRGFRVVLMDVDNVWLRDPFPMLDALSTGMDLTCMYSQYVWQHKGICNTGFVYTIPTRKSKVFWASMVTALKVKQTSDQELFNTVLRHRSFFQFMYRTLPLKYFNKKGSSGKYFDKDKTLVYHAVSVHKVDQMHKFGLWYYKKELLKKVKDKYYFGNEEGGDAVRKG